jgi:Protein of unknown function (DUF3467)
MADETKPEAQPQPQAPPQQMPQFSVDTTSLSTAYANFCRVTGTPEELVLDFGLNTQMNPQPNEPVKLTHRLVMNYFTAKRLLGALHMAVQQHENVYGVLEIDIQKRVRSQPRQAPRPGGGGGFGQ